MNEQEREFLRVVKLLSDNDILNHVILIGSWAEYLYQDTGMIPKGTTALKTLDVDFLIKNLRMPMPPINLEALAYSEGFAVDNDRLLGTTKIRTASRLEVEFLIDQKGAGTEPTYRTAIGVTAQGLRGLDILTCNAVTIDYFGMKVNVPIPEAYVIHKIIINAERKNAAKKEKDRNSIIALFPHLDRSAFDSLLGQVTKKQKKLIDIFSNENLGLIK
jgi:hypothetical protein